MGDSRLSVAAVIARAYRACDGILILLTHFHPLKGFAMSSAIAIPLSQEALSELDQFLLSDACGDDALSIDQAHGFVTALLVSPEPLPEGWPEEIWGQPDFEDAQQQARMTDMLRAMRDDIDETLEGSRPFEPLVIEEEEDGEVYEVYEGWCYGFMLAVAEHPEAWEGLPKDQQSLLTPMAQLALLVSEEQETDMDEDEYLSWVELLPGAVAGLYGFWHRG